MDTDQPGPRLHDNKAHFRGCHERWLDHASHLGEDDYCPMQCGGCRFFIQLRGAFALDWGVCSNPKSPRDGRVTFEHDACDAFVE